jgi:2-phospho-L-lactate transferase/gluconeogenesis factor (CofD/UPF0052 family)
MKNVVAFSGGRGSETFLKSWNSTRPFNLDLLINPYDDGLSTGRIRDFIPGFLGPSDFRKNLVHYLHSNNDKNDYFFAGKLEKRINSLDEAKAFLSSSVSESLEDLVKIQTEKLTHALKMFNTFESQAPEKFDYRDCAIGNLVVAGLFLKHNYDFQKAISELCQIFDSKVGLFTVSNQNDVSLVALTSKGEFLAREHLIVNGLYTGAVTRLGFIESSKLTRSVFFHSGVRTKNDQSEIENAFIRPQASFEATRKLQNADLLCYLPGTQNSSLFPSYQILKEDIHLSKASIKVLVLNLSRDYDMANWKRSDIVKNALIHLGDQQNLRKSITHVLLNSPSNDSSLLDGPVHEICNELGIRLVSKSLASSASPSVHSGEAIIELIEELL